MRRVVWNGGARWLMSDGWIKISGVRMATPNTVYTQQGAKLAYEQDINAKFSHLLLAQQPRTQFTHSKAPNSRARKTSTQNFRTSYWHSYPEQRLHTASCQTRMAATHQHKIFAAPIGTATPNDVYTQQAAKPAWQRRINTKFSQLLLAQLPRATFTHSKLANLHGSGNSYWHMSRGPAATRRAAPPSGGSEYCACHANRSRGPAATRRAATRSEDSEYCACHTKSGRGCVEMNRCKTSTFSRGQ